MKTAAADLQTFAIARVRFIVQQERAATPHRDDVAVLLAEYDRIRQDNEHLRVEKARVWKMCTSPTRMERIQQLLRKVFA